MVKEKPDYRENLELISAAFPGKVTLTYTEVGKLFGYSRPTAQRRWSPYYNPICHGIPVTTIARLMCV